MNMAIILLFITFFLCVHGELKADPETYDYIIVGGGAAGCIVTRRLIDAHKKVLLVEAGGPSLAVFGGNDIVMPPPLNCIDLTKQECKLGRTWFEVPGFTSYVWMYPKYFWQIKPYNCNCAKILGGGSVINGLGWYRGIPIDFEGWPIGWGYDDFLKYYKKVENVTSPDLANSTWRGHEGLIQVSRNTSMPYTADYFYPFVKSAMNYGIPFNQDFNGELRAGIGYVDVNVGNAVRSSTASAYLAPVWGSSNLTVKVYSEATKIIFKGSTAIGVEYFDSMSSQSIVALAQNEVILSAGAIGTPKLLQLSGIGDVDNLNKLGIPLVANVPGVGTNLRNHLYLATSFAIKNGSITNDRSFNLEGSFIDYNLGNRGYFAAVPEKYMEMFVSSTGDNNNPDIYITYGGDNNRVTDLNSIGFSIVLQWAYTSGYVHLASKDPNISANVNFLDPIDPRDIDALAWGIDFVRKLVRVSPFSEMVTNEISPGASVTDQHLRDWIVNNVYDYNHWTGSCALGNTTSPNAVVDPSLLVRNVKNLRVADASVLIHPGNGNIQNTVFAVGEMASDLILGLKQ